MDKAEIKLADLGLTKEFLNSALDHIDKTYPNKLQGQPFILGCAWACGFYKKEISGFETLQARVQELEEILDKKNARIEALHGQLGMAVSSDADKYKLESWEKNVLAETLREYLDKAEEKIQSLEARIKVYHQHCLLRFGHTPMFQELIKDLEKLQGDQP